MNSMQDILASKQEVCASNVVMYYRDHMAKDKTSARIIIVYVRSVT